MPKAADKIKQGLREALKVAKCEHDFWPLQHTDKFYRFMCSKCIAEFNVPREAFTVGQSGSGS